ncbi:hypothetical protein NL676_034155 [Syzygium grande]|nr:hypothetical protein NL676_034155 [Syzygium grande]
MHKHCNPPVIHRDLRSANILLDADFNAKAAVVAVLCLQPEPIYRPLIADALHSFIPLVPIELRGTLKS